MLHSNKNTNIDLVSGCLAVAWMFCVGLVFASCSSSEPPPPPTQETNTTFTDGGEDSSGFGKDEFSGGDDDPLGGEEGDDPIDGGSGSYDRGGAEVGDEDLQEEVTECLDEGKFFDRFANDGGKCTRRKLANVNCTEDGIGDVLSSKQRKQFENALEDDYEDYLIDQCVDCPPGTTSDVCKSSGGSEQEGTKIFFVQEKDAELLGKTMLLPKIRPNQDDSGDEEDEEEEEDEDEEE